jgi:CDP-diacylglycerol--glycerol-3-phosphate 3-phosphatidyltransferase
MDKTMDFAELFLAPNILSLTRILLIPVVAYFLSQPDGRSTAACVGVLALAGVTDFLDGFLARRSKQTSKLGLIVDPLADKLMAVAVVLMLVPTRSMPIWLAAAIIGRDLLILLGAGVLLRKQRITIPSQIAGKYAFFYVVLLAGSYIVRFYEGAQLLIYPVVFLIALSLIGYFRLFIQVLRTGAYEPFKDTQLLRRLRIGFTVLILAYWLYELGSFLLRRSAAA